jgi:hypothetical protein
MRRIEVSAFWKRYYHRTSLVTNYRLLQDSLGILSTSFPAFERTRGTGYGVSLDASWPVSKRLLLQSSYTYQRSKERLPEGNAPTDWDTPHIWNSFATYKVSRSWSASAVFQGRSGFPLTPVIARVLVPDVQLQPFLSSRYEFGTRNSARVPPFERLDIGLQRSWRQRRIDWTMSLQALNVLARTNTFGYDWPAYFCWIAGECENPRASRRGLPFLPSISFAARW